MSYGASVSYGATSTDATLRTSHSITLVNLSPDISYHFIVTSSENGTSTTSSDNTFTTAAATSGGGGGGEGSVGVAAGYGSPAATLATPLSTAVSASSTSVESASTASLIAEIASLEAELVTLQAEANGSTPSSASFSYVFTRNLSYGMTGNDVKELQLFLISEDKEPAARKLAAHGTTKNFAILTLAALIEFQKNAGIHPASGYFGPVTRAYVKNLEKNSSTPNQL
jgi:peptidoglycan hydrolase-like protein with peptidoglycan-binding domain